MSMSEADRVALWEAFKALEREIEAVAGPRVLRIGAGANPRAAHPWTISTAR